MLLKIFILTLILLVILLAGMSIKLWVDPKAEILNHSHDGSSDVLGENKVYYCPECGIKEVVKCEVSSS